MGRKNDDKNKEKKEVIQAEGTIQEEDIKQKSSPVADNKLVGPASVQEEKTEAIPQSNNEKPQLSELENEQLKELIENNRCFHCNLSGLNLSGMDLEKADLEGSDLSNANLEGADLEGANLRATKLIKANLKNANLQESDLYKADLTGADLTGADLEEALMDDTIISGVTGMQVESVLIEKK